MNLRSQISDLRFMISNQVPSDPIILRSEISDLRLIPLGHPVLLICALLFGAVLFVFPSTASAIPLSEYRKNLQNAITALDTLSQMDEGETNSSYEQRLTQTTEGVRKVVPEKQSIESGTFVCTADNSWLHKKLDEFEASSSSERAGIRSQLIQSLKSIEERVGELEKATTVNGLSKDEANQKLAGILARSEYASKAQESSALLRLLNRFIRWLADLFPKPAPLTASHGSPFTRVAQIFVFALAAAVLLFVLFKIFGRLAGRSRQPKVKKRKEPRIVLGERLEPEASATDLLAEAEALARNGEIRAAIRKTYIALLVELGDRRILSLAQHKTNRDYLRAVSGSPVLYSNMVGLTNSFERHWYGFAQTTSTDWQNFRASYLAALRTND